MANFLSSPDNPDSFLNIAPTLVCTCCGAGVSEGDNQDSDRDANGRSPDGTGVCLICGGDPAETVQDEASLRRRYGWAYCMFMDARIAAIAPKLNEKNQARFAAMDYARKCRMIEGLVKKGVIT